MIAVQLIEETAHALMSRATIDIPADYLAGIKAMVQREEGELSSFVLRAMLENYEAATEDRRPMCADTGVPRYAFLCVAILWAASVVIMLMTNAATKRQETVAAE